MRTVYLGLGTNLADRDGWLNRGLALLEEQLVSDLTVAEIYKILKEYRPLRLTILKNQMNKKVKQK